MKYIDAEKLYKKVDELMAYYAKSEEDMDAEGYTDFATYYQGKRTICSEVLDIITSLQQEQPSLPSNLDEAAKDYCNSQPGWENKMDWVEEKDKEECRKDFKAGAEWMAEQGESKEGIVVDNNDFIDFEDNSFIDVCPTLDKKAFNLHDGEKVIVQIRKKEE